MANITASQLKSRLAELLEVPKTQADDILWAFTEVCTSAVESADSIMFPGIGKLDCIVQPSRKARNPATGESIITKPKIAVKFKVSATLKNKAPSLKTKQGKKLLAEAEERQAARQAKAAAKAKGTAKASSKAKPVKKKGTKRASRV